MTDQEKITPEEENKTADQSHESATDTKAELAAMYLDFLDKQKGWFVGLGAAMGASLNPMKQVALDYLISAPKKQEWFFDKVANKVKEQLVQKVNDSAKSLAYDKQSLDAMKTRILQCGDDETKLQALKEQILAGKDPTQTALPETKKPDATSKTNPTLAPEIISVWLVGGTLVKINQAELDKVQENIKDVSLEELTDHLVEIKEVKNKEGKVILECKWETPYINEEAGKDLLVFAELFYQKTGDVLTLESAYRTIDHQKDLKKKTPKLAAEPGKSGHNLGLSIDIRANDRYSEKIGGIPGLQELAAKCNFHPLKGEDRHFDYKKLPAADDRIAIAEEIQKEYKAAA